MTRRAVNRRRFMTKSLERSVSSDILLLVDVIRAGSSSFRADAWIRTSMDRANQDKLIQYRSLSHSSHIGSGLKDKTIQMIPGSPKILLEFLILDCPVPPIHGKSAIFD